MVDTSHRNGINIKSYHNVMGFFLPQVTISAKSSQKRYT